jgi:hypothetical protein
MGVQHVFGANTDPDDVGRDWRDPQRVQCVRERTGALLLDLYRTRGR